MRRQPGNPAESGSVPVRVPGRSDIARDPDEGGPEVFEGIPEGGVGGVVPPVSEGPAESVDGLPVVCRMDVDVDGRTGVVGTGAEARDGQQRGQEDSTGRSPGSIQGKLSLTREHDSTGNRRQHHSPLRRPTDQPTQCSRAMQSSIYGNPSVRPAAARSASTTACLSQRRRIHFFFDDFSPPGRGTTDRCHTQPRSSGPTTSTFLKSVSRNTLATSPARVVWPTK
jgi:hypothetical protein